VKKLLVSGDSWTSCWPLEEELGHRNYGWPTLVASNLDYTLIDKSRAGSSNYRIYRKAFDGILNDQIDTVLVFLTSWTRTEFGGNYGAKPGRIYQHVPANKDKETQYIFKNFFNGYKNYTDLLRMIISLQNLANNLGIECYFLDTFDQNLIFDITMDDFKSILSYNQHVFNNMHDNRVDDKFSKVKMLTSKIDKSKFISTLSYETLISGCQLNKGHPVEDGHAKIANIVLEFLKGK
jgi:hypothetical protein